MNLLKIKQRLNDFYAYRLLAYKIHKRAVLRDPKAEIDRLYEPFFGSKINWSCPQNLIEKIYWLEIFSDTTLWTKCADKYLVRDYVNQNGFGSYLPKLYGKWDNADEIDFEKLPQRFVIKTNHSCGTCIVVNDKSKLNVHNVRQTLNRWLSIPYGYSGTQLHYVSIRPCVIAEELLEQDDNCKLYSPNSLIDYKIWCFKGIPECILVVYDRTNKDYALDLYDLEWNRISENLLQNGTFRFSETALPKPASLSLMIEIAAKLSIPFEEVRVDFYDINGIPFVGELTFSTAWGYFTHDYYDYLGSKVDLSNVKTK